MEQGLTLLFRLVACATGGAAVDQRRETRLAGVHKTYVLCTGRLAVRIKHIFSAHAYNGLFNQILLIVNPETKIHS